MQKIKVTIEANNKTQIIEIPEDSKAQEVVNYIARPMMYFIGYYDKIINDLIPVAEE